MENLYLSPYRRKNQKVLINRILSRRIHKASNSPKRMNHFNSTDRTIIQSRYVISCLTNPKSTLYTGNYKTSQLLKIHSLSKLLLKITSKEYQIYPTLITLSKSQRILQKIGSHTRWLQALTLITSLFRYHFQRSNLRIWL